MRYLGMKRTFFLSLLHRRQPFLDFVWVRRVLTPEIVGMLILLLTSVEAASLQKAVIVDQLLLKYNACSTFLKSEVIMRRSGLNAAIWNFLVWLGQPE